MENIILGLLLLKPRSIYQLRKRIEQGLNLMYSCSTGSIQFAIKKLLEQRYIVVESASEQGRATKLYAVTEQGRAHFDSWINSPINCSVKNPELAKVYFMSFAEPCNRISVIQGYIEELENTYNKLDIICREGDDLVCRDKDGELLFFQLQSAKYGRDFVRFNIDWYTKLLKELGNSNE